MSVLSGVVKFFNSEKGYGFIDVEGQKDIFVHQNDVVTDIGRDLVEGDELRFAIENRTRGLQALKVKVTKPFDVSATGAVDDYVNVNGNNIEEYRSAIQPGIFIPTRPECAARVIAEHFDDLQIEELADCLLVRIS